MEKLNDYLFVDGDHYGLILTRDEILQLRVALGKVNDRDAPFESEGDISTKIWRKLDPLKEASETTWEAVGDPVRLFRRGIS